MKLRKLGKTDLQVSEVGLGCTYMRNMSVELLTTMFEKAMAAGVNFFDCCIANPVDRKNIGAAIAGKREKLIIQGHIGCDMENDQQARTQDLARAKAHMDNLLESLNTDYIDIAMLHCIDQYEEYESALASGLIDYMLEQKAKGVFKYLGFSSHDTATATKMIASGNFDVVMFSINPLFDLVFNDMERFFSMPNDEAYPNTLNVDASRAAFYSYCEEQGVGITVMKALAAGSLVDPNDTPFKQAMTSTQCIHYALNRPAVGSVLIGLKTEEQLDDALAYATATPEELDYTDILHSVTGDVSIKCLYCNHCLPCTTRVDVGEVTRLVDLATSQGKTAELQEQYNQLPVKASACIECGLCVPRCPFAIDIITNMKKAQELFG